MKQDILKLGELACYVCESKIKTTLMVETVDGKPFFFCKLKCHKQWQDEEKQPIVDYPIFAKYCKQCGGEIDQNRGEFCSDFCQDDNDMEVELKEKRKKFLSWIRKCIAVAVGLAIVVGYYYFSH